uniref:Uncharacterized protein n=1 Tax=Angiostrongylus cantonensis TaxID=6313 RepID=A0A0K0DM85_ANGCA
MRSALNFRLKIFFIRAAVPVKSKVSFAVAAVKQHLIRSLTARAELQYESMDVVEEAAAGPCSVHQMPRPATTVLDTHPAILFSDYLFEADTVEDAQSNFDELLGLKVNKGKLFHLVTYYSILYKLLFRCFRTY